MSLRNLPRQMKKGLRAIRQGLDHSSLNSIDFQSGLGDSAYLLYGLVRSVKPQIVVEIGSARGRSACFIGMALKENGGGKLYAIDPHTLTDWNDANSVNSFGILTSNIRRLGLDNYVEILRETSDRVASDWTREIDLIFIDGDHSYEGVKRDWESFAPFVRPFGGVVFHDTLWSLNPNPEYSRSDMGVPRFVDELRMQGHPVITIDRDFGVSLIQPVRTGVSLLTNTNSELRRESGGAEPDDL